MIIVTFVTSSMFILVYEANTYNLLVQKNYFLKQSPIASKVCLENMQQIYRGKPIRKCDFKKRCMARLYGCSTVNLLGIFRLPF